MISIKSLVFGLEESQGAEIRIPGHRSQGMSEAGKDLFTLTPEEKNYLSSRVVSDSDPGLLVRWNLAALEAFAAAANGPGPFPPRPAFIHQPITVSSLLQDFATHAGALGGGMLDPYLLAPNNALQYSRVLSRIEREIPYDPYIQAVAAAAGGEALASLAVISDNRVVRAEPLALSTGAGMLPIFT